MNSSTTEYKYVKAAQDRKSALIITALTVAVITASFVQLTRIL